MILNVNWLSAISLTVLCAMMFLTFANVALACCCEELRQAAVEVNNAFAEAIENYNINVHRFEKNTSSWNKGKYFSQTSLKGR